MLKRSITYRDLDNNVLTEDFFFHYSIAEATELKIVFGDNIQDKIKMLIDSENAKEVITIFKGIIADSVGIRSSNGKSFVKNDTIRDEFMGSDAYSELLLWLLSDQKNMERFVNGIFPENMIERVTELAAPKSIAKTTIELPVDNQSTSSVLKSKPNLNVVPEKKFEDYTKDELLEMPMDQFIALKTFGSL